MFAKGVSSVSKCFGAWQYLTGELGTTNGVLWPTVITSPPVEMELSQSVCTCDRPSSQSCREREKKRERIVWDEKADKNIGILANKFYQTSLKGNTPFCSYKKTKKAWLNLMLSSVLLANTVLTPKLPVDSYRVVTAHNIRHSVYLLLYWCFFVCLFVFQPNVSVFSCLLQF